jgi:hypothetical protein
MELTDMSGRSSYFAGVLVLLPVIASLTGGRPASATTRPIFREWKSIYRELNNGSDPEWKSQEEAETWLREHEADVEPIVLEILRGERTNRPWTSALVTARAIPTHAIAVAATARFRDALSEERNLVVFVNSPNSYILGLVEIIGLAAYEPARPLLHRLVAVEGQSQSALEVCFKALRKIGDRDTLSVVAGLRSRCTDAATTNLCALTEKILDAKLRGADALDGATGELRAVNRAWVEAIEERDYDGYVKINPLGVRRGIDRNLYEQVLKEPTTPEILRALKGIAGREEFEVDADKLEASLVVDGRYKFDYVLEADGWKIGGPTQIAP